MNGAAKYLCIMGIAWAMAAQAQIPVADFIRSALSDLEVHAYDDQISYLSGKPYILPPIRNLEFRFRSNELDRSLLDYALRIQPANPWEMKYTAEYYRNFRSTLDAGRDLELKQALVMRYRMAIEAMYLQDVVALKQRDDNLLDNQVAVLEAQQASESFDAEDLVKLKLDQMDLWVEMEEYAFEVGEKAADREAISPGAADLLWEGLTPISAKQMRMLMESSTIDGASPSLAYRQNRIDLALSEFKLERSNVNVGFVQTRYEPYRLDKESLPWNISLGFTIPLFNPNKGDMSKRKLEAIEAESDFNKEKLEVEQSRAVSKTLLNELLDRYDTLKVRTGRLKTGTLSATLQSLKGHNPSAVLRFERNLLKLQVMQEKLRRQVLLAFVDWLAATDQIQEQPLINYLSATLDEISP